jgi:hypothetical protein
MLPSTGFTGTRRNITERKNIRIATETINKNGISVTIILTGLGKNQPLTILHTLKTNLFFF